MFSSIGSNWIQLVQVEDVDDPYHDPYHDTLCLTAASGSLPMTILWLRCSRQECIEQI
jgi:hypothetical protein